MVSALARTLTLVHMYPILPHEPEPRVLLSPTIAWSTCAWSKYTRSLPPFSPPPPLPTSLKHCSHFRSTFSPDLTKRPPPPPYSGIVPPHGGVPKTSREYDDEGMHPASERLYSNAVKKNARALEHHETSGFINDVPHPQSPRYSCMFAFTRLTVCGRVRVCATQ